MYFLSFLCLHFQLLLSASVYARPVVIKSPYHTSGSACAVIGRFLFLAWLECEYIQNLSILWTITYSCWKWFYLFWLAVIIIIIIIIIIKKEEIKVTLKTIQDAMRRRENRAMPL